MAGLTGMATVQLSLLLQVPSPCLLSPVVRVLSAGPAPASVSVSRSPGWPSLGGGPRAAGHSPACPPWQVNETSFRNLTREEAVQFLLGLPPGEEMALLMQRKQDSEWPALGRGHPCCRTRPQRSLGRLARALGGAHVPLRPQSSRRWCSRAWATPSTSARTSSWSRARPRAWASRGATSSTWWTHSTRALGPVTAEATGWRRAWAGTCGSRSAASSPTRAGGSLCPRPCLLPLRVGLHQGHTVALSGSSWPQ